VVFIIVLILLLLYDFKQNIRLQRYELFGIRQKKVANYFAPDAKNPRISLPPKRLIASGWQGIDFASLRTLLGDACNILPGSAFFFLVGELCEFYELI